jgi:DNA-binding transcriptional ArsR family regulator
MARRHRRATSARRPHPARIVVRDPWLAAGGARPGVSRHLRVLREAGLVDVRKESQRRVYILRPEALAEVDDWLGPYRTLWEQRLDALHTEIARGKRERRSKT